MTNFSVDAPRLVADVGGTNARFALVFSSMALNHIEVFPCEEFVSLYDAIKHYLKKYQSEYHTPIRHFVIAIANPVTGDMIKMTNHHWQFSISEMKAKLNAETLLVINDFTAQALAMSKMTDEYLTPIGGTAITTERKNTLPIAVVGPGTGLGVSGLIPDGHGHMVALSGEGGHIAFSPTGETERKLLAFAEAIFNGHVSAERLLQGDGLTLLYHFFAQEQGLNNLAGKLLDQIKPADITLAALTDNDPLCQKVLSHYCAILGSVCADIVLVIGGVGGVYICGGIVPRFVDFLRQSDFRRRFEAKGRFADYMKPIPIYVVNHPYPGLLGAAVALQQHENNEKLFKESQRC